MNTILSLLGLVRRDFNMITKGLTKMVQDLEAHAVSEIATAETKAAEAMRLLDEHDDHRREALRATSVATKVAGLLDV